MSFEVSVWTAYLFFEIPTDLLLPLVGIAGVIITIRMLIDRIVP